MRRRSPALARKVATLAAIQAACAATVASAQLEPVTGSRIGRPAPAAPASDSHMSDKDQARAGLVAFGQCVVLTSRRPAERAIAMNPNDPAAYTALARLATPDCLRDADMHIPYPLMRGALYLGLYRADFARMEPPLRAEPTDMLKEMNGATDSASRQYMAQRDLGECIVRAAPKASRELLLAKSTTSRENAAFAAVIPKIGPCLVQGYTVALSKIYVTSIVAEALYRLSTPAPAPAAGTH